MDAEPAKEEGLVRLVHKDDAGKVVNVKPMHVDAWKYMGYEPTNTDKKETENGTRRRK